VVPMPPSPSSSPSTPAPTVTAAAAESSNSGSGGTTGGGGGLFGRMRDSEDRAKRAQVKWGEVEGVGRGGGGWRERMVAVAGDGGRWERRGGGVHELQYSVVVVGITGAS
jgi:hypothetical protein